MKNYILLITLLFSLTFYSQVGVNTNNPLGAMHIDAAKDNTGSTPTISQAINDFIIDANGNIGVGNVTPRVKFDARDLDNNTATYSALGIGDTDLTATVAGEGAIKYHEESGIAKIYYSNGITWIETNSAPATSKISFMATSNTALNIAYNADTKITVWKSTIADPNFNATTGEYTITKNGLYTVNAGFLLTNGANVIANSNVKLKFVVIDDTQPLASRESKNICVSGYPNTTTSNIYTGENCNMTFYLKQGQRVRIDAFQNTVSGGRALHTTVGFNFFNIREN